MAGDSTFSINGPDSFAGAMLYVGIGILILSYGGYDYVQQTEAVRDSVEVDATVTDLAIETDSGSSSTPGVNYDPTVEFEYRYDGTEYTGTKLYPANIERTYDTRSAAESAIEEYDQGTETVAYVPPDQPSDAFLKNQTSNAPFVAIGLGGLFTMLATRSAVKKM